MGEAMRPPNHRQSPRQITSPLQPGPQHGSYVSLTNTLFIGPESVLEAQITIAPSCSVYRGIMFRMLEILWPAQQFHWPARTDLATVLTRRDLV